MALGLTLTFYFILILLVIFVYAKICTRWCRSSVCLKGKTTIVTGANTGIGYETALDFAKRGAKVILACRDENKAKQAVEAIVKETDNTNVSYRLVDFGDLASIRKFAKEIKESEDRLDILVNNAGAGGLLGKTQDGLNAMMQSNYYGPFLLTVLLLDLVKKTPSARVVNVASLVAKFSSVDVENLETSEDGDGAVWGAKLYAKTKLCNILFTLELASRLKGTDVTTYSLHPGSVNTDIFRKLPTWLLFLKDSTATLYLKTPLEGCQTTLYCSLQKGIENYNGEHFENCTYLGKYGSVKQLLREDPHIPRKLWEKTESLLGLQKKVT